MQKQILYLCDGSWEKPSEDFRVILAAADGILLPAEALAAAAADCRTPLFACLDAADVDAALSAIARGAAHVFLPLSTQADAAVLASLSQKLGKERVGAILDAEAPLGLFSLAEMAGAGMLFLRTVEEAAVSTLAAASRLPLILAGEPHDMAQMDRLFTQNETLAALALAGVKFTPAGVKQYLTRKGHTFELPADWPDYFLKLQFNADGLIPAIVQEADDQTVLMMAWMNLYSLQLTLQKGLTYFYSRSRKQLWQKGESSGHVQRVQQIYYDCDGDTLLILAKQTGVACHEGDYSCFHHLMQERKAE